jgi:hypothetical protein
LSTVPTVIEVVPQPRIDLLVDTPDGTRRRRTEYAGTVWYGGRPQLTAMGAMSMTQGARIESPFFLPDSLPYRADALDGAVLQCTVAAANISDHVYLFENEASFVTDPSGAPTWVQVRVLATARVPLALSYRVIALTSLDAVTEG